jgi:hypothetical protein
LETLTLAHSTQPTRRLQWRSEIRGSYGEQDYMSLSQTLSTQPTLPLASTMVMAEGSTGPSYRISRQTSLSSGLSLTYRRTLDSSTSGSGNTLPTQIVIGMTPSLSHALTRDSGISVSSTVSDYDIQASGATAPVGATAPAGRTNMITIQSQIGLAERLNRVHQLQLSAGMIYSKVLKGASASAGSPISPVAQVALNSDFYRTAYLTLRSLVSAGATKVVDPVRGNGRSRGLATAGLNAQIDRRWGCDLRASFASDISKPDSSSAISDDSMMVSLDSSLRHSWPSLVALEFGARFSERATHPAAPQFAWRGRELWFTLSIYTAATASLSSVHPPANPVGR